MDQEILAKISFVEDILKKSESNFVKKLISIYTLRVFAIYCLKLSLISKLKGFPEEFHLNFVDLLNYDFVSEFELKKVINSFDFRFRYDYLFISFPFFFCNFCGKKNIFIGDNDFLSLFFEPFRDVEEKTDWEEYKQRWYIKDFTDIIGSYAE